MFRHDWPRLQENVMRRGTLPAIAAPFIALALAACGGPDSAGGPNAGGASNVLEGDAVLIAAAQDISDALHGCKRADDEQAESRVVGLGTGAIVMLGCSQSDYSTTHRIFAVRSGAEP
jgi:hypothetical protein